MNQLAVTVIPSGRRASRPTVSPLLVFFFIGWMQTLLAYVVFSRADDHGYFLELANSGVSIIPQFSQDELTLKAQAAGAVFYALCTPSRWLGGHELLHLLWLRGLTLVGFLAAFHWFVRVAAPALPRSSRKRAMTAYMVLLLFYPGQLAWTASLLRDGIATALFFYGLYCLQVNWRLIFSAVFFGASFAMRPEYSLILICLAFALMFHRILSRVSRRVMFLVFILLLFSMASHSIQVQAAAFGQLAFSEDGMAYPLVTGVFDLPGYARVLLQAVLEPIALSAPHLNAFGLIDCGFFGYLLWHSRTMLRQRQTRIAALSMALLFGLWVFAYFEIYVSGFSRHRLCLQVALIALLAVSRVMPDKIRPAR